MKGLFEEVVPELNELEQKLALEFARGFGRRVGKDQAISANRICRIYREKGIHLTDARIRKIVQYLRLNHLVMNLIAGPKGYYVSNDPEEIRHYMESVQQRINSMTLMKESFNPNV